MAELLERCKQIARMVGQGREIQAECSYCQGAVPLHEALFTQQIAGVLAHISCPEEQLADIWGEAVPLAEFDYQGFSAAVDKRMQQDLPAEACAGEIELMAPPGDDSDGE